MASWTDSKICFNKNEKLFKIGSSFRKTYTIKLMIKLQSIYLSKIYLKVSKGQVGDTLHLINFALCMQLPQCYCNLICILTSLIILVYSVKKTSGKLWVNDKSLVALGFHYS